MSNLLPCPFCGGESEYYKRYIGYGSLGLGAHDWFFVKCEKCRTKSDEYKTEAEAIAAWNRRAQPENSRQHALQTGVCPMCEDCPDGCPVETPNDSRNRPENEPLTLDELRQMDGEPVWVQELIPVKDGYWDIHLNTDDDAGDYENFLRIPLKKRCYGKSWLAYRTKPERSEG